MGLNWARDWTQYWAQGWACYWARVVVLIGMIGFGFSDAQQTVHGQMLALASAEGRFLRWQVDGFNQDNKPSRWQESLGPPKGLTLAISRNWWWQGNAKLEFFLAGEGKRTCEVKGIGSGAFVVLVMYSNSEKRCIADRDNTTPEARQIADWASNLFYWRSDLANKFMPYLNTLQDGYRCVLEVSKANSAQSDRVLAYSCEGLPIELLHELRK